MIVCYVWAVTGIKTVAVRHEFAGNSKINLARFASNALPLRRNGQENTKLLTQFPSSFPCTISTSAGPHDVTFTRQNLQVFTIL